MMQIISPHIFHKISGKVLVPISLLSVLLFALGIYYALFSSPADYQQGEMVRVMYVHVPAAWMSLGIYMFIALCSLLSIVWRLKLAYLFAASAAPIGASFAAITLITGALWGKPIWGAWWVWDARLTSMLVLFLLYLAYIAVINAGDDIFRAEKPAAAIALLGAINVPIVKFSVDIWNSLHQPSSVLKLSGPAIDNSMLAPLFIMFSAFIAFFISIWILKVKTLINKVKYDLRSN
ncbi:MAG: cytochrome c biogenesis protein CcsA [Bacteroidetes bacterium]|nr:cytochrome c biogenesis protein CcsA [Bacteroidota bacterium]